MNKTQLPNGQWQLDAADGHILHRTGSDDFTAIRHCRAANPDEWEEISEGEANSLTAAREAEAAYKARIISLIRTRYDHDDEIAILRQCDTKPNEFAEYNAFVEECKDKARAEVENESESNQ